MIVQLWQSRLTSFDDVSVYKSRDQLCIDTFFQQKESCCGAGELVGFGGLLGMKVMGQIKVGLALGGE
jgi:hypothetical protein